MVEIGIISMFVPGDMVKFNAWAREDVHLNNCKVYGIEYASISDFVTGNSVTKRLVELDIDSTMIVLRASRDFDWVKVFCGKTKQIAGVHRDWLGIVE